MVQRTLSMRYWGYNVVNWAEKENFSLGHSMEVFQGASGSTVFSHPFMLPLLQPKSSGKQTSFSKQQLNSKLEISSKQKLLPF